jgi:fatty-acyl-CoA synthase
MEFNLAELFHAVAAAIPDRTALVAGAARRTYRELDSRADRFARYLADVGVRPRDHIGIYAHNRAEWLEAMLGCYKARAVPINVNYRYVRDELQYLFDNADLVGLVYEAGFEDLVAAVRPGLPRLEHLVVLEDGTAHGALPAVEFEHALMSVPDDASAAAPGLSADDLYILYTGGTTGMPKGVMWRQEDIFFAALGGGNYAGAPIKRPAEIVEHISPTPTVTLAVAPLMHGQAQWTSFISFFGGNTVVLNTLRTLDADGLWDLVEREHVSVVSVVGDAMARPLLDALAQRDHVPPTLFAVVSGGAIMSPVVKEQLHHLAPNVVVVDAFGASETGANGAVDITETGPRFRMNEWTTVLTEDGERAQPGENGLLARRGHVPLGYYKDPQKSAATFVVHDGERWAVPGDRAVIEPDGIITVLGRGSQCINTGGEKVFPEEVEATLKSHPDVFDAIVVGVPDERWGETVAAVVAPRPGRRPTLEDLAEHARHTLASYKCPRHLILVDEVERTPAGKPNYRWAKDLAARA